MKCPDGTYQQQLDWALARVDDLEQTVTDLRRQVAHNTHSEFTAFVASELDLRYSQVRYVIALISAGGRPLSHKHLAESAAINFDAVTDIHNLVSVQICLCRQALPKHCIDTIRGQGFLATPKLLMIGRELRAKFEALAVAA